MTDERPVDALDVPSGESDSPAGADVPPDAAAIPASPSLWNRVGFALVNVWLVYHLLAIVIAPSSVSPSSRIQQQSWRVVGRYLQSLYLNHGWHYFSPEPGRSTLLSYTLEFPDGTVETGRLPNADIQPRLLYHRYFMLTEFLGNSNPERQAVWHRAYARQLLRESGAHRVTLSKVFHELPLAERILAGGTMEDPEFYTEEPIGAFESSEL